MLLLSSSTNVFQRNLDSFLVIAEDLKFQGLMGQMEDVQNKTETFYKKEKSKLKGEQIQLNFEPKIEKDPLNVNMKSENLMTNQLTGVGSGDTCVSNKALKCMRKL